MENAISEVYGGKVRVRACGLCWHGTSLLMVNHSGLNHGDFWAPPGGGIEFGASIVENLKREFLEETGLIVSTGRFLFGCEFIKQPLHAIELFFEVNAVGGELRTGSDPELQIIRDSRFIAFSEIKKLQASSVHSIFTRVQTPEELNNLRGFFTL